jgi:(p)ppGpp synthase/HD superfamily hydrolase
MHPLRVMANVDGLAAKIVAILHDVIEDTAVTEDDLKAEGFPAPLVESVLCLTHRDGESYADYVVRCKRDEVARRVKLADLEDNARPARVLFRADRLASDSQRVSRYLLAHKFLTDAMSEADYRKAMASLPG